MYTIAFFLGVLALLSALIGEVVFSLYIRDILMQMIVFSVIEEVAKLVFLLKVFEKKMFAWKVNVALCLLFAIGFFGVELVFATLSAPIRSVSLFIGPILVHVVTVFLIGGGIIFSKKRFSVAWIAVSFILASLLHIFYNVTVYYQSYTKPFL